MPTELTRLVAVNRMMTAIGMPTVDTIDSNVNALVAQAVSILDEAELELVTQPWYFNTETDVEFTPDSEGFIAIPSDILQADSEDPTINVVRRGSRLYSQDDNSFEFDAPITLTILRGLSWLDLPPQVRNVITKRATQYLAERFDRDGGLVQRLMIEADKAYRDLLIDNADREDANMIFDNPDIHRVVRPGRGPLDYGAY